MLFCTRYFCANLTFLLHATTPLATQCPSKVEYRSFRDFFHLRINKQYWQQHKMDKQFKQSYNDL